MEESSKERSYTYKFFQIFAWNDMIAAFKTFVNNDVLPHSYKLIDVGLTCTAKTEKENDAIGYCIYDKN